MIAPQEKIAEAREILTKEPERGIYKVLGAIEVLVGSKIGQGLKTSAAERIIFASTWLAREVGTGGFHQFFINSAGDYWRDVLNGLIAIGDKQGLALFRETLSIFPDSIPSEDRDSRLEQIIALEEDDQDKVSRHFNQMNQQYFSNPFPSWELVFDYVKSHPNEFNLENA